jgi:hypothetical protein
MWQKSTKAILDAREVFHLLKETLLLCVLSGLLGYLINQWIAHKVEWYDKLSAVLLAISLTIFYGFIFNRWRMADRLGARSWVEKIQLGLGFISVLIGLLADRLF